MMTLKLMAGAARSMVVASARTTLDGRRMCEPMKKKPRRPHDRSAGLFLVRFGIALIDYRNGMQHAKRANGTSRTRVTRRALKSSTAPSKERCKFQVAVKTKVLVRGELTSLPNASTTLCTRGPTHATFKRPLNALPNVALARILGTTLRPLPPQSANRRTLAVCTQRLRLRSSGSSPQVPHRFPTFREVHAQSPPHT
jgi:hypothetical protein